jgi:hypothetical protein
VGERAGSRTGLHDAQVTAARVIRNSQASAKAHDPDRKATTLPETTVRRVEQDLFPERIVVLVSREPIVVGS